VPYKEKVTNFPPTSRRVKLIKEWWKTVGMRWSSWQLTLSGWWKIVVVVVFFLILEWGAVSLLFTFCLTQRTCLTYHQPQECRHSTMRGAMSCDIQAIVGKKVSCIFSNMGNFWTILLVLCAFPVNLVWLQLKLICADFC
jgi:hypothetical protein